MDGSVTGSDPGVYPGRLGLQQRVLPTYRKGFFEALAKVCQGGLSLFVGQPLPDESIQTLQTLDNARIYAAKNSHLGSPASPLFLCWQHGFQHWLQEYQPDALVVEANPRYLSTYQAIRWMHQRGRLVLGWGLGAPGLHGRLGFLRRWEKRILLRSLDGIIAYSRRGAKEYQLLGFPARNIFVAHNAVSAPPITPPPERSVGLNAGGVVLFIGRLQKRKRVDNLLRACAALPLELQPECIIVGDGPARQDYMELAAQVYPSARFAGACHGADLQPYLAAADLFVLPGTGGLAIQQAMTAGLAVIAAEGDGTQEDLVRAENGWLIPAGDLNALRDCLQQALSDPARLLRMGMESYRIVSQEINIQAMARVFVEALHKISTNQVSG